MSLKHFYSFVLPILMITTFSACTKGSNEFRYTSDIQSELINQMISVCADVEYGSENATKQICREGATDHLGRMQVFLNGVVSEHMDATAKILDVKFFALVNGKKMNFKLVDTSEVRFFDHFTDGKVLLKL